jgi:hypothetical protein
VDGFRQNQHGELKALSESTYDQNEQVKRISAWAAILFAPTLIGTIYGMNVVNLPGADESWGIWLSGDSFKTMSRILQGMRRVVSPPRESESTRNQSWWYRAVETGSLLQ